jgi:hypothetical protein
VRFGAVVGVVEGLTVVRVVVKQFIPASSYKAGPALTIGVSRVAKPSRSDVEDALYSADREVRHCGMRSRLISRRRGCWDCDGRL